MVKKLPGKQETWVWSLSWEDPLEKGMATHSSILAWRIPWTEEPDGLQFTGSQRVGQDWVTNTHKHTHTHIHTHTQESPRRFVNLQMLDPTTRDSDLVDLACCLGICISSFSSAAKISRITLGSLHLTPSQLKFLQLETGPMNYSLDLKWVATVYK